MSRQENIGKDPIGIIGVPLGYGAGKTGSELGVEAMRLSRVRGETLAQHIAGLGYSVTDFGNVDVIRPNYLADGENPRYLPEMLASCRNMIESLDAVLDAGCVPVILGGDHSIAIGTFSAVSNHFKDRGKEIGLIWFDAHADINTPETSASGNIHGMPLAVLLGEGPQELVQLNGYAPKLDKTYFAHVGARDLDAGERDRIRAHGLRDQFFSMADIDKRGMLDCVKDAIAIASKAPGGFAVTFDVDVMDPTFAPGSGTLVRGGATYREAHLALEVIAESGGLRSFEIVEVNPLLDQSNITVELAVELVLSALGKVII
jgi:arginase